VSCLILVCVAACKLSHVLSSLMHLSFLPSLFA
jgi:hypothetical protein